MGNQGLFRTCAPAKKSSGLLGAYLFYYCLLREEQDKENPQRPTRALAPVFGEKKEAA
jgi:hypothetical protein